MTHRGYLGIDLGTQGVSVIFTDEALTILATGEAGQPTRRAAAGPAGGRLGA